MTFKERMRKAEDSNLNFLGRVILVVIIASLLSAPAIIFTSLGFWSGGLLATIVATVMFWGLSTLCLFFVFFAILTTVSIIGWVIWGDDKKTSKVVDDIKDVVEKIFYTIVILYLVIFGDYKDKWLDLKYFFNPNLKAKELLNNGDVDGY